MIKTLLVTNSIFLIVVFILFEFLHRIFPIVYHPQDIIHGELSLDGPERDPSISFRAWVKRKEATAWGRVKGFLSELWIIKVATIPLEDFVARSGVSVASYLRWKRFIVNCLLTFSLGSLIVLVPTNYVGGGQCRDEEGKRPPLWICVSTHRVQASPNYFGFHVSLLALFGVYFVAAYASFLRRHVSLHQHLFQRPLVSSYSIMLRRIPVGLRTREGIEAMVSDVFPDIARVVPEPANVDKLALIRNDVLALETKLRAAYSVPEHWFGTQPRIEGSIPGEGPFSLVLDRTRSWGDLEALAPNESPCGSQLQTFSDAYTSDAPPGGLPAFVSYASKFADIQSPYARAYQRREQALLHKGKRRRAREAELQSQLCVDDQPAATPKARARRRGRYDITRQRAMYRGARTELQRLRGEFFLPSSPTASVAFVTFRTKAAAQSASTRLFYPDSTKPTVEPAPDPDDVLWQNLGRADMPTAGRVFYFIFTTFTLFVFYLVPVTAINTLLASSTWDPASADSSLGWLNDLVVWLTGDSVSTLVRLYLPSLLLSALMGLLPVVIRAQCNAAGPLTQSLLNTWTASIYFGFLVFNVFIQQLLVNVASEILKLMIGMGSDVLTKLFSLNNKTLANALVDNATFFAIYILQQHLLGSGLVVLSFGNLFSVLMSYVGHVRLRHKLRGAERRRHGRGRGRKRDEMPFRPPHLTPNSGKIQPFNLSRILATDAFITGLCALYCIFSPLLSPLVLVIFLIKDAVDRYVLYHISPPLPIFQSSHDLVLTSTKWLSGGFIIGACFDAIYFTTYGFTMFGFFCLLIAVVVAFSIISIHLRYRRSLSTAACALPPEYRDLEARRVVEAARYDRGLVTDPEETKTRTDYECPLFNDTAN